MRSSWVVCVPRLSWQLYIVKIDLRLEYACVKLTSWGIPRGAKFRVKSFILRMPRRYLFDSLNSDGRAIGVLIAKVNAGLSQDHCPATRKHRTGGAFREGVCMED